MSQTFDTKATPAGNPNNSSATATTGSKAPVSIDGIIDKLLQVCNSVSKNNNG